MVKYTSTAAAVVQASHELAPPQAAQPPAPQADPSHQIISRSPHKSMPQHQLETPQQLAPQHLAPQQPVPQQFAPQHLAITVVAPQQQSAPQNTLSQQHASWCAYALQCSRCFSTRLKSTTFHTQRQTVMSLPQNQITLLCWKRASLQAEQHVDSSVERAGEILELVHDIKRLKRHVL